MRNRFRGYSVVVALALCAAGQAFALPGTGGAFGRLPQAQGGARHMPPPGGRERWEDRRRLREEVKGGRLTREEALRQYRERHPERPHGERRRLSDEEREQLRRDILEAERNLGRR